MSEIRYYALGELKTEAPSLFGVSTGTKLDEMFFKLVEEKGKFVKKPLGGIPYLSIINITGVPDTGKSILVEQFALTQASKGYKVLFVTVESPANFLYTSLRTKAEALNINFERVEEEIFVIDASVSDEFRENPSALMDTMAYVIRNERINNVVIDSITGLYEHKEILARQIVRKFFNFLKKFKQTGLFVSQKRSTQASETAEAAGGLAVAHIVDGTIVLDKKIIDTKWEMQLYKKPIGSIIRTIRIDGCRLTGHDSRSWVFEITTAGIIKIIAPLEEYIKIGEEK